MALKLTNYSDGELRLSAKDDIIMISGTLDKVDSGKNLKPFFEEAHSELLKLNMKSVTIDLTNLVFMNSTAFRELVTWAVKIEALPENQKYKFKFVMSTQHLWQSGSIGALKALTPDIVEIIKP